MPALEYIISFALLLLGLEAVEITRFEVPELAKTHENATLVCKYELEHGEVLRALRWFYDNETFYEIVPGENPVKNHYPIPGLNIDFRGSNETHLRITNLRPVNRGEYRCVVVSGHPIDRDMRTGLMHVYSINIHPQTLELADNSALKFVCSNPISRPMARLSFKINGLKAPEQFVVQKRNNLRERGPHYTSQAELNIPRSAASPAGPISVSCTATYLVAKNISTAEVVIRVSGKDTYRRNNSRGINFPAANISGDVRNYNIGDQVTLNCTFERPMPEPSELVWTLNGVFNPVISVTDFSHDGIKKKGIRFELAADMLSPLNGENAELAVGCWAKLYNTVYVREVVERFSVTPTSIRKIDH